MLINSLTDDLKTLVQTKMKAQIIDESQIGGSVYANVMLDQMFCLTAELVIAIQDFLKQFSVNGLTGVTGENAPFIVNHFEVVATRLVEVDELPLGHNQPLKVKTGTGGSNQGGGGTEPPPSSAGSNQGIDANFNELVENTRKIFQTLSPSTQDLDTPNIGLS